MNSEKYKGATFHLSREEQELLLQLGNVTGDDGVAVAMDMDIRHGLMTALGDMGNTVQTLLTLLNETGLDRPLSAMPSYDRLLESIAAAANSGAGWITKSHEFDQSALLALSPEPSAWVQ